MNAINKIQSGTFAAACYDMNSAAELKAMLAGAVDANDCTEWNITPAEWREQIELAIAGLEEKAAD